MDGTDLWMDGWMDGIRMDRCRRDNDWMGE